MKTAHQLAAEIAAQVAEHGALKFMGNKPYTPNEFRAEIAERAILADRAQRAEQPAYKVGDPDPTPNDWEDEDVCEANQGWFTCTWRANHDGIPHVAGDESTIVAVWS